MWARILRTAVLLSSFGVSVATAGQVTIVLNTGERHSGTLIYGRANNALVDGHFRLNSAGSEKRFGLAEVAAVNPAGQRREYSIARVSRVYVTGARARSALSSAGETAVGTTGSGLRVLANRPWTDSGLDVKQGERYVFEGKGEIIVAPGAVGTVDGVPGMRSHTYPLPAEAGMLLAKVGNGAAFGIGSNSRPIAMPASGRLYIGINDDFFGDNSGAFTVVVTRQTDLFERR
jgi:hypothetical protein